MIGFLHGKIGYIEENTLFIDVNGVGYEVYMPINSNILMKKIGDEALVFTSMIVREDEMSLYGFDTKEGVALFRKLITVNGVGAKAAMAILSVLSPMDLVKAITFGDATMLTRANGVGKKGAERIILELGDKLDNIKVGGANIRSKADNDEKLNASDYKADAIEALLSLGYSRIEASEAVLSVDSEFNSVEEYVKAALRRF